MRKVLIICLAGLFSQSLLAQSPGYMGKHLQVYVGLAPNFQFREIDAEVLGFKEYYDVPATYRDLGVGVYPMGGAEITLNRTFVLGADAQFTSSKVPLGFYFNDSDGLSNPDAYFGEGKYHGLMTGYYVKIYSNRRRGYIAPIGRYHQFEFLIGKGSISSSGFHTEDYTDMVSSGYYFGTSVEYVEPHATIEELKFEKFKMATLQYTFGGETVLFDRFPADFGIQFTLPSEFVNDRIFEYGDIDYGTASYYDAVSSAFLASTFIGLRMRIGYFLL